MESITTIRKPLLSEGKVSSRVLGTKVAPVKEALNTDFPVVGIGASAGGLESLEQFFKNLPNDNGIVQLKLLSLILLPLQ